MLQEAGVVEKEPGRGQYRRRRERRPMVGMLVHLEGRECRKFRVREPYNGAQLRGEGEEYGNEQGRRDCG
jgi:hypothetical protein